MSWRASRGAWAALERRSGVRGGGVARYADTKSGTTCECAVRVLVRFTEIRVLRTHNLSQVDVRDRFLYRVYIIWYRLDSVYRDLTLVLEGLNIS